MLALKQGSVPDVIANKLDHLLILTSGTEQYLITCTNKKYKFLLTTTLTISEWKKLPVLKVGRKVLIKTDILEMFMEANEGRDLRDRGNVKAVTRTAAN